MYAVSQISGGSIACLLNENGDLREDVLQKLHEVCKNELAALLCDGVVPLPPPCLPLSASVTGNRTHPQYWRALQVSL